MYQQSGACASFAFFLFFDCPLKQFLSFRTMAQRLGLSISLQFLWSYRGHSGYSFDKIYPRSLSINCPLNGHHLPLDRLRPLKNPLFCPITASGSDFNPQNTQCIPAVKIFAFDSGHPCPFTAAGPPPASPILLSCRIVLTLNKIGRFSKVSRYEPSRGILSY